LSTKLISRMHDNTAVLVASCSTAYCFYCVRYL